MVTTALYGVHFGDEGKGKIVDYLANDYDIVARWNGGDNAGHTVETQNSKIALHLVPSGIIRKGKINVIGNNVVIDPFNLLKEIDDLRKMSVEITPENLAISDRCHLTLPYHLRLDELNGKSVGTTGRGIGPTYTDKVSRTGIRLCDLLDLSNNELNSKINENLSEKNLLISRKEWKSTVNFQECYEYLLKARDKISPFINRDIGKIVLEHDGSLLYESAQGTLLDVDLGTYPYVTSSNPTIGGAFTGTGVWVDFNTKLGILKAYTTRVGNGPFPAEQVNEFGERLRKNGFEFGATTGRARRCGALDLVIARYSARVNGISEISLTKLDVLSSEDKIPVCIGYKIDGKNIDYFPAYLDKVEPVYQELDGWRTDITNARRADELPKEARDYIMFIQEFLGVPIKRVGVGPGRDQVIEIFR